MNAGAMRPREIEEKSLAIIRQTLDEQGKKVPEETAFIIHRVIHTTADFDYADSLYVTPGIVEETNALLQQGVQLVCDTNMARAGINKAALAKLDGSLHCFMAEEDVAREARERDVTRALVSMERASRLPNPLIIAVGNAPTALLRICELYHEGKINPSLVIGVPVGFVNVVESKEQLIRSGIPCIVAQGRKGGSNVAAAICNALLYQCAGRADS